MANGRMIPLLLVFGARRAVLVKPRKNEFS